MRACNETCIETQRVHTFETQRVIYLIHFIVKYYVNKELSIQNHSNKHFFKFI